MKEDKEKQDPASEADPVFLMGRIVIILKKRKAYKELLRHKRR